MKARMKKGVKIMKASELYTREYGAAAYKAYMRREAEIDALMRDKKRYTVRDICTLREDNFRRMKAEGARRMVARVARPTAKRMAA